MDNHIHVLCRLDPGVATGWSDEEVVRRWIAVYPPASLAVDDPKTVQTWVDHHASDTSEVAKYRERLQDLGWFMKALKEPLARLANKEDDCKGRFGRPGISRSPFSTRRLCSRRAPTTRADLESAIEESHWLCPLEDRRAKGSAREGLLAGFSLASYLELVDWTARLCRTGKARVSEDIAGIMTRLGTTAEFWGARMREVLPKGRLLGNYCTTRPERLKEIAANRGVHHVDNALGAALT